MSRIFPAPCFLFLLPFAFSPTLSCVQAPTHTYSCISCPHPTPYATDMLFLSFVWWKSRVFHAPAQSSSHQTCIFWSHLVYDVFSLHPFLPFLLSWTDPVALFPMYVCVGGGFAAPEQSRLCQLVNGAKERGVEGAAWWSSPASPTSLANNLRWSWGWG